MPIRCRSRFKREIFRPIAIPAVILTDQLKKIHIVGELDILDTPRWYARLAKKDYANRIKRDRRQRDDPDGNIVENYSCKSERNYTQYCNAEVDRLLAAQSSEPDKEKRKKNRLGYRASSCGRRGSPDHSLRGGRQLLAALREEFHAARNSQYNNVRFEEVWLDK